MSRELRERWINDFSALGPEVDVKGKKVRPDTRVSIAIGKVARLEEKGNNNLQLVVKVAGAKYDFQGFLNDNSPVANLLKEAKERDLPVCARFEKKRKRDADPTKTMDELTVDQNTARDNIVNVVAGVYNFNNDEWILTDDVVSNPDEDPENVKKEIKGASYSTAGFFGDENKGPKIDNNWKANHLISMYTYASEHLMENDLELKQNVIKSFAGSLLKAVDKLQMEANDIDQPNYNDYSHTKARGMLFSWMRINPLTTEEMKNFGTWINRFVEESLDVWEWAKTEAEKDNE